MSGVDARGLPETPSGSKEELRIQFAGSIGPDSWEKRSNGFDFRLKPGSFPDQGRMKTSMGDQP